MTTEARFAKYMSPILESLRDLGGSARPREVYDAVASRLEITSAERDQENESGTSRFENEVAWARFYLARTGYLDSSKRGVWSLTDLGREAGTLDGESLSGIIRAVQSQNRAKPDASKPSDVELEKIVEKEVESTAPEDAPSGYRERTLELLLALPPSGFERLCQRLLRESGFQKVRVTGKTADGGIDGIGILQITPFVTFKVLFQCKRWANVVGSPTIRDFRGAMAGRADKGIILTTGTYSSEALAEAVRDGVPPIELVDGKLLIDLLEQLELGLTPRTTYEVDFKFFEEFQK